MALYHTGTRGRRPHVAAPQKAAATSARRPPAAGKAEIAVVGDDLATVIALATAAESAGSRVSALHRSEVLAAASSALTREPSALLLIRSPAVSTPLTGLFLHAGRTVVALVSVKPGRPVRADVTYTIPGKPSHQTDLQTFLRLQAARRTTKVTEVSRSTPERAVAASNRQSPGILLVEDDPAIAEVLERALAARGWTVAISSTGSDAIAAVKRSGAGLLLLDINLPDITGWEVLRRLSDEERAAMPVVVYSASPLSQVRVAEFRPAGVLTKPFPVAALIRLVRELTGSPEQREAIADA